MSTYNFLGRVALVTGGGSGIGRACCQILAREGARVVVADLNLQSAQHTLSLLPGPQHHLALAVDVRNKSSIEAAISSARDQCGTPPSLLVSSAGVIETDLLLQVQEDSWMNMMDINLKGTFLVNQAFTKALIDSKTDVQGVIVNIASILAKTGYKDAGVYSATKGGVISLSKSCAAELAKQNIRVNCVLPGLIQTPMSADADVAMVEGYKKITPLGRLGRPEEVAEVIVFLLSDRSSYMVGACVEVSGGYAM